jgi:hypothetical protein
MKTLREYIDQLDEISRRDALKYAGAAALGGAAGFYKGAEGQVDKNTAYDCGFLWGFTAAAEETLKDAAYPQLNLLLKDMVKKTIEFHERLPKNIKENPWYSQGYSAGIRHFHTREFNSRTTDGVKNLTRTFDMLLDRARESSYGYPQKIFKEEETTKEDPIQKVDRLFRDK